MTLVWGVCSVLTKELETLHEVSPIAIKEAVAKHFAKKGDDIIITAGIPFALKGNTNIIHVLTVK